MILAAAIYAGLAVAFSLLVWGLCRAAANGDRELDGDRPDGVWKGPK